MGVNRYCLAPMRDLDVSVHAQMYLFGERSRVSGDATFAQRINCRMIGRWRVEWPSRGPADPAKLAPNRPSIGDGCRLFSKGFYVFYGREKTLKRLFNVNVFLVCPPFFPRDFTFRVDLTFRNV